MKRSVAIFAMLLCSCKSGCNRTPDASSSTTVTEQAMERNAFAYRLYEKAASRQGSFAIAPPVAAVALELAYKGADGKTTEALARGLGLDSDAGRPDYGAMAAYLAAPERENAALRASYRLWVDKSFAVTPQYKQSVNDRFAPLDFSGAPDASRDAINTWVTDQTRGAISSLLWTSAVDSQTRLLLTSAVHFRGRWNTQFDPARTKPNPFALAKHRDAMLPTMVGTLHLPYGETDQLTLVEMPCAAGDTSLVIVVPKLDVPLADVEKRFIAGDLRKWLARTAARDVLLSLPKFTVSTRDNLTMPLTELGMGEAFGLQGDYSKLAPEAKNVGLAGMAHGVTVEVDEGQPTASAPGAAPPPGANLAGTSDVPARLAANVPFLFVVLDRQTGTVLVAGRYVRP